MCIYIYIYVPVFIYANTCLYVYKCKSRCMSCVFICCNKQYIVYSNMHICMYIYIIYNG